MGLQQSVNTGLRDEVALGFGKPDRQLSRAQLRLFQGQFDDLVMDMLRDPVPDPARARGFVLQRLWTARLIKIVPAIEGGSADADPLQRLTRRQVRLFDMLDDLGFLSCGISHSSSPPPAIMLFFSNLFSRVRSATTSFRAVASRRRVLTSSVVAARAVSPASRRLPLSRISIHWIDILPHPGTPWTRHNRGSGRCLPCGRSQRCCPRREGRPARSGSGLRQRNGGGSRGGCPWRSVRRMSSLRRRVLVSTAFLRHCDETKTLL